MRVLKKEWGDFWQIELHELIKDHLTANSHDNGALESAGYTAENSAQAEVEDLKEDIRLANLRIEVLTRQLVIERLRNGKLTNMVHRKKAAER